MSMLLRVCFEARYTHAILGVLVMQLAACTTASTVKLAFKLQSIGCSCQCMNAAMSHLLCDAFLAFEMS